MPLVFLADSWTIQWFVDGWGKRCRYTVLKSAANPKFRYGKWEIPNTKIPLTLISRNLQQHSPYSRGIGWTSTSSEPPETPSLWEDFASIPPLFCSHHVFLVFHFLGFVCRSMPMLEKLSMPLAVRLAGITNCHVFVHALRTIKWKISYLQYNSHVITHIH